MGGTAWAPVADNWTERVRLIACEPDRLNKAVAAAQKTGKQDPFARLGLVYVGDMTIGGELSDVTWATFWKDGRRPAYTSIRTPAEREARRRQALAELKKAEAEFGAKATQVQQDLEMQNKIDRALGSTNEKYLREMQGTTGWSEEKVVAHWGPPHSASEANGILRFDYHFQDTMTDAVPVTDNVMGCQGGVCGKVGESMRYEMRSRVVNCRRTLFLKAGGTEPGRRLYDFQISCG